MDIALSVGIEAGAVHPITANNDWTNLTMQLATSIAALTEDHDLRISEKRGPAYVQFAGQD